MSKLANQIVTVMGWVYPETRAWEREQILSESDRSPQMARDLQRIRKALAGLLSRSSDHVAEPDDFNDCTRIAQLLEVLEDPQRHEIFDLNPLSDGELAELLALSLGSSLRGSTDVEFTEQGMASLGDAMRSALGSPSWVSPPPEQPSGEMVTLQVDTSPRFRKRKTRASNIRIWGAMGLTLSFLILVAWIGSLWLQQQPIRDQAEHRGDKDASGGIGSETDSGEVDEDSRSFRPLFQTPRVVDDSDLPSPTSPFEQWQPQPGIVKQNPEPQVDPLHQLKPFWEKVRGLVVFRQQPGAGWRSLNQSASSAFTGAIDQFELLSVGNGWAHVDLEDPALDRSIGMVVANAADVSGHFHWTEHWNVEIELKHGAIALRDLPEETTLKVTYRDVESRWSVAQDSTSVQFEIVDGQLHVASDAGNVVFEEESIEAPASWVCADGNWIRRSTPKLPGWPTRPSQETAAETRVLNEMLGEEDLVTGLLANRGWERPEDQELAIRWAIELDANQAIPLSFRSAQSLQHLVALSWLIDPAHSLDDVAPVVRAMDDVWASTPRQVPRWIAAMRGDSPMNRALVLDMVDGLHPQEPLFVRVVAKAFLEAVLAQPLAPYDPERPDLQTIRRISTRVRQRLDQSR